MGNNENILEVQHLKQYFGKNDFKAVDDVSFSLKKGEVLGIVGESGCGKTTTGRSIIKLFPATSGNVYFKGQSDSTSFISPFIVQSFTNTVHLSWIEMCPHKCTC